MPATVTPQQLDDFCAYTIYACLDAGSAILEIYNSEIKVDFKEDASPLTEADRRSHHILVHHLSSISHANNIHIPILSEEGIKIPYKERKLWDWFWLVDPLDGTKEFVKRNGEFTVNVALVEKNRPVMGVVYLPAKAVLYFAVTERGSFFVDTDGATALKEGIRPIDLKRDVLKAAQTCSNSGSEDFSFLKITQSRSHASTEEETFASRLKRSFPEVSAVSAGSSLKFCLLARHKADIYPRFGPTMEWDTAAGQCILEQAGGSVLEMATSAALSYNKPSLRNEAFIALASRLRAGSTQRQIIMQALRNQFCE
jgi:3'(2'), 5'-bisphosphate nucleotidase